MCTILHVHVAVVLLSGALLRQDSQCNPHVSIAFHRLYNPVFVQRRPWWPCHPKVICSRPNWYCLQVKPSDCTFCSATVMSHVTSLPPCQGTRVRPSGRLPPSLVRPVGSLEAGMPAEDNYRKLCHSWHYAWLFCWGPACRSGRVVPEHPP